MNKEISYGYLQETLKLKENIENGFLSLGERLMKIRDEEMWKAGYDSFADYLEEMKMSESNASKLISVYSKYILEYDIEPEKVLAVGGHSVAYAILPFAKSKEKAEEWLEKGRHLTRQHIEQEIREMKTGIRIDECDHDWNEVHIRQCRSCGLREKVHDDA